MKETMNLQHLANVYNNNRDGLWEPSGVVFFIDEDLLIQATFKIKPKIIYFKSLEIAKVCSNLFYGTSYKIER